MKALKTLVAVAVTLLANAAQADITIGISLPLTGPASGLGIPMNNYIKLWPTEIAGEKLKVIVLDDATDPTKGVSNAKKFVTEDKVDIIMGSAATPVAIAMADTAAESGTPQFMFSPAVLPAGKDFWAFRLPQGNAVMAHAMIEHMKKNGVKTVGFLGYTDAYGESWLNDFKAQSQLLGGPQIVAVERFARADTSVTGQALKLVAANPDAMLVVASGSGAAMPHKGIIERGYKGKMYQTHAAASRDLVRVGGKDVEGAFVSSGPAVIPEQLPANHPSRALAADFVAKYEKAYGAGNRNQFAGHAYDAIVVLEKVVPVALKKGKPGSKEFRAGIRDAVETMGRTVVSHGVLNYTKDNHWGFTTETGVILKVVNGDWKVE
ncbi:ABC transporter substrate-binding protein [Rhizobacter sp. AJA081-3]|uniref:ABC transporter substrate-binding protein n=1 Tax=Rhizobacter sp. AJA081-3 TaxID=2753607 RepID=UPI001AE0571C|nr:ABC transporter substrate-binding protein [Rhizobacter sp. AJA081-3]QTN22580.1 ABC transporter substrate-binding protein [Rhizobacter sp. AJA081-3]